MWIASFSLEADYSFLNIKKIVCYIKTGNQIDQKWQIAIGIDIFWYSSLSYSKPTLFDVSIKVGIDGDIFWKFHQKV